MTGKYSTARAVGDIVYPYGSPQKLGRVIETSTLKGDVPESWRGSVYEQRLVVRWQDGSVIECDGDDVLLLDDLIADHEKKLAGHRARREKARKEIKL